jgi:hypothetical protein
LIPNRLIELLTREMSCHLTTVVFLHDGLTHVGGDNTPLDTVYQYPGPMLTAVMKDATEYDMKQLYFMNSAVISIYGIEGCRISRCGYTGEDGVEVTVCTVFQIGSRQGIICGRGERWV